MSFLIKKVTFFAFISLVAYAPIKAASFDAAQESAYAAAAHAHHNTNEYSHLSQEQKNERLLEAATYNNRKVMTISKTKSEHISNIKCRPCLLNIQCLAELLICGAEVNTTDANGMTALHHATGKGDIAAMKILMRHGADVNAKDTEGSEPIHFAAEYGHAEAIQLLIDHDANVRAQNNSTIAPIHCAANHNHVAAMEVLLDNGADVNHANRHNEHPLHYAAAGGSFETVELLLQHRIGKLRVRAAAVNAEANNHVTPLCAAVIHGQVETAELLLARGAWAYRPGNQHTHYRGRHPMHYAAIGGNPIAIKQLIARGGQVSTIDDWCNQDTPLSLAVKHCRDKAVRTLLAHGATMHDIHPDKFARFVAGKKHMVALHLVLDHEHANLNPQNESAKIALMAETAWSLPVGIIQLIATYKGLEQDEQIVLGTSNLEPDKKVSLGSAFINTCYRKTLDTPTTGFVIPRLEHKKAALEHAKIWLEQENDPVKQAHLQQHVTFLEKIVDPEQKYLIKRLTRKAFATLPPSRRTQPHLPPQLPPVREEHTPSSDICATMIAIS